MSGVAPLGGMGLVADPREGRRSVSEATGGYANRVLRTLHDKNVTFEEYLHYAKISRDEENRLYGPGSDFRAAPGPTKSFFMRHVARKQSVSREDPAKRFSISEAVFSGKDGAHQAELADLFHRFHGEVRIFVPLHDVGGDLALGEFAHALFELQLFVVQLEIQGVLLWGKAYYNTGENVEEIRVPTGWLISAFLFENSAHHHKYHYAEGVSASSEMNFSKTSLDSRRPRAVRRTEFPCCAIRPCWVRSAMIWE